MPGGIASVPGGIALDEPKKAFIFVISSITGRIFWVFLSIVPSAFPTPDLFFKKLMRILHDCSKFANFSVSIALAATAANFATVTFSIPVSSVNGFT